MTIIIAIAIIRPELIGTDTCIAAGITATGYAPVLTLCRLLVAAGHDPRQRLDVYRDNILALRVRSIGVAARLEIDGHGAGFRPAKEWGAAPPMRLPRKGLSDIGADIFERVLAKGVV